MKEEKHNRVSHYKQGALRKEKETNRTEVYVATRRWVPSEVGLGQKELGNAQGSPHFMLVVQEKWKNPPRQKS